MPRSSSLIIRLCLPAARIAGRSALVIPCRPGEGCAGLTLRIAWLGCVASRRNVLCRAGARPCRYPWCVDNSAGSGLIRSAGVPGPLRPALWRPAVQPAARLLWKANMSRRQWRPEPHLSERLARGAPDHGDTAARLNCCWSRERRSLTGLHRQPVSAARRARREAAGGLTLCHLARRWK